MLRKTQQWYLECWELWPFTHQYSLWDLSKLCGNKMTNLICEVILRGKIILMHFTDNIWNHFTLLMQWLLIIKYEFLSVAHFSLSCIKPFLFYSSFQPENLFCLMQLPLMMKHLSQPLWQIVPPLTKCPAQIAKALVQIQLFGKIITTIPLTNHVINKQFYGKLRNIFIYEVDKKKFFFLFSNEEKNSYF